MIFHARYITASDCVAVACRQFNVEAREVLSQRRSLPAARARQAAMWLAKQLTPRSYPEIGRLIGNRDHSTAMHAVRRIDELRAVDPEFRALTDRCMHDLTGRDERQEELVI
jgi:chromosomal replication initiator protein